MAKQVSENPFPVQAVSVWGGKPTAVASLKHMHRFRKILVNYIKADQGAGPVIALSGGHGSGKTFLLNWLSDQVASIKSAGARVLYAKTGSSSFVGAYRLLLGNLTRPELIEVVRRALLTLGHARAGAAIATERESRDIVRTGSMDAAYETKVLDPNEVQLDLRNALVDNKRASEVSRRVAIAIALIEHPDFGESAFAWLQGKSTENLPDEALRAPLLAIGGDQADQVAVDALGTIAALFKTADVPLLVFLDEFENFVPPEKAATASQIVKTLGEQLSLRSAILVMAGTPVAWENLPRDLWPRFYDRAPMAVGARDVGDTAELLQIYLREEPGVRFSREIVATIQQIAGGNSREILQIGHHAYAICGGDIASLSVEDVMTAATRSGSLVDRGNLARQMLRDVIAELGLAAWSGSEADATLSTLTIEAQNGARAEIALAIAADAHAESQLAHRIASLQRGLAEDGSPGEVVVITVGYSSSRVQDLLADGARTILFEEETFKDEMRAALRTALAAARVPPVEPPGSSPLEEKLAALEETLARIEAERRAAEERTQALIAERAAAAAAPEIRETEVRTRYELREGLDMLSDALSENYLDDERRIIRGLLIDNEAHIGNRAFETLGTIYVDALDVVRAYSYSSDLSPDDFRELKTLRLDILSHLRKRYDDNSFLSARKQQYRIILSIFSSSIIGIYLYMTLLRPERVFGPSTLNYIYPSIEYYLIVVVATIGVGVGPFFFSEWIDRPEVRFRRFRSRLNAIKRSIAESDDGPSRASAASPPTSP